LRAYLAILATAIAATHCLAAEIASKGDFDALLSARSIHCEFYRSVRPADAPEPGDPGITAELLIHYGALNRSRTRAKAVSTHGAGAREIRIMRTDKAVHFVEHSAGMFSVTTVFGCNRRERSASAGRCTSYGAVHARHFDSAVMWEPDKVFENYRPLGNHGFCDHGFVTTGEP
jgi:hypothetical protein